MAVALMTEERALTVEREMGQKKGRAASVDATLGPFRHA